VQLNPSVHAAPSAPCALHLPLEHQPDWQKKSSVQSAPSGDGATQTPVPKLQRPDVQSAPPVQGAPSLGVMAVQTPFVHAPDQHSYSCAHASPSATGVTQWPT
jgi:hypothetical protein